MKLFLFALVLATGVASAAYAAAQANSHTAQPYVNQPQADITLPQALQASLANNPQLAGYQLRREALAGEAFNARLRPVSELQFEAENLAGSGSKRGTDAAEFTLSFASVVELGGQRSARIGAVTARQQQLASEQRVAVLDVVAGVNERFIALLAAQQQVALAQEAKALAQTLSDGLVKRVNAGSTPKAELLRARASFARAAIALDGARQQQREAALQLSAYWAEPNPAFNQARGDLFQVPGAAPLATWQALLANNPDVALLADASRLSAAQRRQAEAEGKLALGWSAGVRQYQEGDEAALVLGVNIPLAAGRRASGALQTARAEQGIAELAEQTARSQLQAHLQQTYGVHQQALAELKLLRDDVVPLLADASRDTATAFAQGRYSSLELALAQRELLEARADLINAALRAHQTRIELERLTASAEFSTANTAMPATGEVIP